MSVEEAQEHCTDREDLSRCVASVTATPAEPRTNKQSSL